MLQTVRWLIAVLLLSALYGIINCMGKAVLTQSRYAVASEKVASPVTIAVVADLHNTLYGKQQSRLLGRIADIKPDIVVIAGDAFHARANERHTLAALAALGERYPCYFVTGNHERNTGACADIKKTVRALGITVLESDCVTVSVNGQSIQLAGLDDYGHADVSLLHTALTAISEGMRPELFSVLLVHRPERFDTYLPFGFDVILAGHAHGGQWRLPGAPNGLFAPGQGWLPRYAGGQYAFGKQTMCVSRGLSNKPIWLARIGNPPEIMIVTVSPA